MGLCKKICFGASIFLGVAMIIIGGAILGVFPGIMEKKIQESLSLKNDSEALERFIESPVANYMKFHLFNVKNKDAANKGEKPDLEEKGPYVYRQNKVKSIVDWNDAKGTVSYREVTEYYFEEEMSNGKLTDVINHVNAVAIGIRYNSLFKMVGMLTGKTDEQVLQDFRGTYVTTHTADELLFGGIDVAESLPAYTPEMLLPMIPKSGFFTDRNGTTSKDWKKPFEVYTGVKGMSNYCEVLTYNNKPNLTYWFGEPCNAINGTDGKQFPPGVDTKKELYVFSTDICRSMKFIYQEDSIVEKIDTVRYAVPEYIFEDPNKNKDNMCFCHEDPNKQCPSKKGVIPIFQCQEDKPVAMSAPHFYFGEEEYKNKFTGLKPEKDKHETFLDIEPMTGTVIQGAKRIQMNLIIEPYEHLKMISHIKELSYFPLFWAEEGGKIDEKNAKEFRDKVTNPYKAGKWSSVAVLAIGCVILLVAVITAIFKGCSS